MLTASPKIARSKVKEPHFFFDGHDDGPSMLAAYEECFVDQPGATLRMEATAIYFYAVPRVPAMIQDILPNARIIIIFREPYARLVSEFKYLKTRLLIPADLSLEDYVTNCMALPDADWRQRNNRHLLGVRNGYYHRFFPDWVARFGDRIRVVFHDDLAADPERLMLSLTKWLDLPPIAMGNSVAIENKGVSFRAAGLQRCALAINDGLESFFRRNRRLKAVLRSAYYRVNGARPESVQPLPQDHPLRLAYRDSGQVFRAQLLEWDPSLVLPAWLGERTQEG